MIMMFNIDSDDHDIIGSKVTSLVICLNEIKMGVIAKAVLFPVRCWWWVVVVVDHDDIDDDDDDDDLTDRNL
jgi:hypothetical protein